jgi:hypothetical protein
MSTKKLLTLDRTKQPGFVEILGQMTDAMGEKGQPDGVHR